MKAWIAAAAAGAALIVGCTAPQRAAEPGPPPVQATPAPSVAAPQPAAPASAPAPAAPSRGDGVRLACEDGVEVRVRFAGDEAQVAGLPSGPERLLRDAGGVTPQQSVYSNPRLRAEFGLGADASAAALHLLQDYPRTLHCRRG